MHERNVRPNLIYCEKREAGAGRKAVEDERRLQQRPFERAFEVLELHRDGVGGGSGEGGERRGYERRGGPARVALGVHCTACVALDVQERTLLSCGAIGRGAAMNSVGRCGRRRGWQRALAGRQRVWWEGC